MVDPNLPAFIEHLQGMYTCTVHLLWRGVEREATTTVAPVARCARERLVCQCTIVARFFFIDLLACAGPGTAGSKHGRRVYISIGAGAVRWSAAWRAHGLDAPLWTEISPYRNAQPQLTNKQQLSDQASSHVVFSTPTNMGTVAPPFWLRGTRTLHSTLRAFCGRQGSDNGERAQVTCHGGPASGKSHGVALRQ